MQKDISTLLGLSATLNVESARVDLRTTSELEIFRTLQDLANLGVFTDAGELSAEVLAKPLSYIYRMLNDEEVRHVQGVAPTSDAGVKFDITVLVGHQQLDEDWRFEFPKTSGHYHTALPGSQYASPDFYQVVSGHGLIMLQHQVGATMVAKAVPVKEGDTLLIAPHLGHTSVNLGDEPLVFSNVCVRRPHLNYEDIHRFGGAPYLVRRDPATGQPIFDVNDAYGAEGLEVLPLEFVETDWDVMEGLGIRPQVSIYEYISNSETTAMLCHPDPRHDELERALKPTT